MTARFKLTILVALAALVMAALTVINIWQAS
jgi:hypothetical protein